MLRQFNRRSTTIAAFLVFSVLVVSIHTPTVVASSSRLEIMSVIFPDEVPYNQTIPVKIMVSYAGNTTPSVSVYYWILPNSSSTTNGWRIAAALPVLVLPEQGVTVYSTTLPSNVFDDTLAYGMEIVFWVKAVQDSTIVSTVEGADVWNPSVLQGKFLVRIVDPYPPTIKHVSLDPENSTSSDDVTVRVIFASTVLGANVTQAWLEYSVNGVQPGMKIGMTQSAAGIFEATIPAQITGSQVSYQVTGYDAAGNSVQNDWAGYVVSPSQAELAKAEQDRAAQTSLLVMVAGLVAGVAAAVLAVILYRRRTRARSRVKALATRIPSACNSFTVSVVLSIAVVGWAAYSISQYGHAWLGLVSLLAVVELWGLADPKMSSVFGLFRARPSGVSATVFEAFRTPGAPLLVSAYTLVFVGTVAAFFMNLGGFINKDGLLAIMRFFASYGLLLVGLAAVMRYLAYVFAVTKR